MFNNEVKTELDKESRLWSGRKENEITWKSRVSRRKWPSVRYV